VVKTLERSLKNRGQPAADEGERVNETGGGKGLQTTEKAGEKGKRWESAAGTSPHCESTSSFEGENRS